MKIKLVTGEEYDHPSSNKKTGGKKWKDIGLVLKSLG